MFNRQSVRLHCQAALFGLVCLSIAGVAFDRLPRISQADEIAPSALALETVFCPSRIPSNRTMGLVQRNFLDLLENSKSKLQIAIVLDGTASMRDSLAGIKTTISKMMDDLELYKHAEVSYQLVVFRDIGAAAEVNFPIKVAGQQFTSDRKAFQSTLESIEVQSGAPYFPELIDAGVHQAITKLNWSDDQDTTKWLLVMGDAPPFEQGFEDAEINARRRFDTRHLAALATSKGIHVNCILCLSRAEERESYEAVLDRTRQFMSTLASETGGLMLDLSYPDIRKAVLTAAQKPRDQYSPIGKITRDEVNLLRERARQQNSPLSETRRARIAVLPHAPLERMTFRPDRPEVRLASDLRRRFRGISGVRVKSSRAVQQQFMQLRLEGLQETQMLQMLASALNVDFVLWGHMSQANNTVEIDTSIFRRLDGKPVASGRGSKETVVDATKDLVVSVVNASAANRTDPKLASVFRGLGGDQQAVLQLTTPVSNESAAVDPLLEGYDLLEQAAAFEAGAPDAEPILGQAQKVLSVAVSKDPRNPIAHQLLANCHFSRAQAAQRTGDQEAAKREIVTARAELEKAKNMRNSRTIGEDMKTELLADYALLGQTNVTEAIQHYEKLTNAAANGQRIQLHMALRAHWMLAGIYSGDWGVANEFVDGKKAREHLMAVLAHWPQSREAEFIRTQLRWNHEKGENAFEYYPKQHRTDLIDS